MVTLESSYESHNDSQIRNLPRGTLRAYAKFDPLEFE